MFRKPEPADPRREAIARHMRIADDLTRKRQYEDALFEIEKALKIDAKNNNVRQFYERVKVYQQKTQNAQKAKEAAAEMSLEQRMEVIPKFLAQAEQLLAKRDYKGALSQLAEVYKIDPTNYYAQAFSDRIDQLMSEERSAASKAFRAVAAPTNAEGVAGTAAGPEGGSLIFYRELLKQYWFDGKLNEKETAHLAEVRALFGISDDDDERLSKEVKFDAYVEALWLAWIDGVVTDTERRLLESMRDKYDISPTEHQQAESRVSQLRKENGAKPVILIVDEDKNHSLAVSKGLRARGYDIAFASKPEDAFQILQNSVPSAILAEAKYASSTTDGFELYRRVHAVPATSLVPFFFTVRITDRDMLLAALRTGVDHVLVKPADPEFILAAIDGKRHRNTF
jgi:CheY-like chemotaxis protein/predicted Zn-dependent protease with MMP-like domain